MLLYHIQAVRKLIGGKWAKVSSSFFFGFRWVHLDPEAIEFDESYQNGSLIPKVHCLNCLWLGSLDRAATGVYDQTFKGKPVSLVCADGSVTNTGDHIKVCPVCGSELFEQSQT